MQLIDYMLERNYRFTAFIQYNICDNIYLQIIDGDIFQLAKELNVKVYEDAYQYGFIYKNYKVLRGKNEKGII